MRGYNAPLTADAQAELIEGLLYPESTFVLVRHIPTFVARRGKKCAKCGRTLSLPPFVDHRPRCSPKHQLICDRNTATARPA